MDNFFSTLIVILFFLLVIGGFWGYYDGYREGQIDALTGHATYCLDDKYEWVSGQPGEELRCEVR